ncbi:YqgE/AlgH family protein [Polymorphobacter sp.]|uniref:YqgE/AlgH family protein n=1 Tax=Polymorphobacter sp. TaxID=1909290 RepID=UPI003F727B17
MPGIGDPRFERAVIAICLHDEDGALGLVCNKVMDGMTVPELMRQLDIDPGVTPERPVMEGGPVDPQRGFVLHSGEYQGQGTIAVSNGQQGWGLTSTLDVLKDIAIGKGPRHWLAALGYTGWGAGQLDDEMTRHGWQAAPGEDRILFETALDERWPAGFAGLGISIGRLSAEAGRA